MESCTGRHVIYDLLFVFQLYFFTIGYSQNILVFHSKRHGDIPTGTQKILDIYLLVSTEYTNVTDRRTDGQTPHDGIGRADA